MYSPYIDKDDGLDKEAELRFGLEVFGAELKSPLGHQWGIGLHLQSHASPEEIRARLLPSGFMIESVGTTEEYPDNYARNNDRIQVYPSGKYGHINLFVAIPSQNGQLPGVTKESW
jgi:hypothetical protein